MTNVFLVLEILIKEELTRFICLERPNFQQSKTLGIVRWDKPISAECPLKSYLQHSKKSYFCYTEWNEAHFRVHEIITWDKFNHVYKNVQKNVKKLGKNTAVTISAPLMVQSCISFINHVLFRKLNFIFWD